MSGSPDRAILPPWVLEPHRLWSLADMTRFPVGELHGLLTSLSRTLEELKSRPANEPIPVADRKRFTDWLSEFFLEPIDFLDDRTQRQIVDLTARLVAIPNYTWAIFAADLANFEDRLSELVDEVNFAYVPAARAKYFAQDELFGNAVATAFPSARGDIREAGDCLSTGAFTAAVFHLMRAVEHLLRAFVIALGVTRTPKTQAIPLEYQEWQNLIEQAESRIGKRLGSPWKSRVGKIKAQDVLRASIADFYSFKDNVRNQ